MKESFQDIVIPAELAHRLRQVFHLGAVPRTLDDLTLSDSMNLGPFTGGWETLVLTPNEKLIARAIINAAREQKQTPALAEIAKAVAISQSDVKRGLAMLEQYQILKCDESVGGVGYAVAAPRYLNWHPRLDFVFHRMTVSQGSNTILTSVN